MKLRYIFTMLAAALAFAFVGCQEEERFLEEVQVDKSFVALSVEGDTKEITVNAVADWAFAEIPEWLTVSPAAGTAGKTVVTFTAAKADATNEAVLELVCAGKTQLITVLQMAEKVDLPLSTCKDVINGEDGVVYRVKGAVTSIANTQYGNWYLDDGTGSVYVYGTLYEGAEKQFEKHGIEVGDVVTVEGPRKDYSGTIELVNVTVIDIEKSLIQLDSNEVKLTQPAGEFQLNVVSKAGGLNAKPDCDWITVTGIEVAGEKCVVNMTYTSNEHLVSRTGTIQLSIGDARSAVSFVQDPRPMTDADIVDKTIAEVLAAEVSTDVYYRVTGKVTKIADAEKGNLYIKAATGEELYVYGLTEKKLAPGSKNDKSFANIGLKPGDIVTVVGTRAEYKGDAQMAGPCWYESHEPYKAVSINDFLAAAVDTETLYELTGVITEIKNATYGNLYIEDKDGNSAYIYGVTEFPLEEGAKNDKSFASLELLVGDTLTVRGYRGEYKGDAQMVNGYYACHTAPARETYTYKKATAVTSGKSYAIVANDGTDLQAAMPVAESSNYGYLNPAKAAADGDKITMTAKNEFVFTAVEGGYTITQPDGRLLYMSGTFNSFNVKKDAAEGQVWTVEIAADGTATITNVAMSKYVQYSTEHKSYGAYPTAQAGAAMPVLYERVTE